MVKLDLAKHILYRGELRGRRIIRGGYCQDASSTFSNKYAKSKILTKPSLMSGNHRLQETAQAFSPK
jgi:hypothetical protein